MLVTREINGSLKSHNVLLDTPMNIPRRTFTPDNYQIKHNFEKIVAKNNVEHERKLWTYEENRKFLEASQKFGLDYKKI